MTCGAARLEKAGQKGCCRRREEKKEGGKSKSNKPANQMQRARGKKGNRKSRGGAL